MSLIVPVGLDLTGVEQGLAQLTRLMAGGLGRLDSLLDQITQLSAQSDSAGSGLKQLNQQLAKMNRAGTKATEQTDLLARSIASLSDSLTKLDGTTLDRLSRVKLTGLSQSSGATARTLTEVGSTATLAASGVHAMTVEEVQAVRSGTTLLALNERLTRVGSQYYRYTTDQTEAVKLLKKATESSLSPANKTALLLEQLTLESTDATRATQELARAQERLGAKLADQNTREAANRGRSLSMLFDELKGSIASRIPGGTFLMQFINEAKESSGPVRDIFDEYANGGKKLKLVDGAAQSAAGQIAATGAVSGRLGAALSALGGPVGIAVGSLAALTAAVTGGVLSLAMGAKEYQREMVKLQNVAGATSDQMRLFETTAMSLALSKSIVPEESIKGLQDLVSLGYSANDAIKLLPVAIDTAKASGLSLAESSRVVGGALKAFGLETDQARKAADMLVGASNLTAIQFEDLASAVSKSAKGAAVAKQDMTSLLMTIGLAKNVGLDVEVAATGVNSALTSMVSGGRQALADLLGKTEPLIDKSTGSFRRFEDVLLDISGKLEGMSDPQRAATLNKIFGSEGLTAVAPILQQINSGITDAEGRLLRGADAVQYMRSQFDAMGGTVDKFATSQMTTLSGQMDRFGSILSTLTTFIGSKFAPLVAGALKYLNDFMQSFTEATLNLAGQTTTPVDKQIQHWQKSVESDRKKLEDLSQQMAKASPTMGTLQPLIEQYQTTQKQIEYGLSRLKELGITQAEAGKPVVSPAAPKPIESTTIMSGQLSDVETKLAELRVKETELQALRTSGQVSQLEFEKQMILLAKERDRLNQKAKPTKSTIKATDAIAEQKAYVAQLDSTRIRLAAIEEMESSLNQQRKAKQIGTKAYQSALDRINQMRKAAIESESVSLEQQADLANTIHKIRSETTAIVSMQSEDWLSLTNAVMSSKIAVEDYNDAVTRLTQPDLFTGRVAGPRSAQMDQGGAIDPSKIKGLDPRTVERQSSSLAERVNQGVIAAFQQGRIGAFFDSIFGDAEDAGEEGGNKFIKGVKRVTQVAKSIFSGVFQVGGMILGGLESLLGESILSIVNRLGAGAGGMVQSVLAKFGNPSMFGKVADGLLSVMATLADSRLIKRIGSSLTGALTKFAAGVPKVLPDAIKGLLIGLADSLPTLIPALIDSLVAVVSSVASVLSDDKFIERLGRGLSDAFEYLAGPGLDSLLQAALALVNGIANLIPTLVPLMVQLGANVVVGIIKNLPAILGSLIGTLVDLVIQTLLIGTASLLESIGLTKQADNVRATAANAQVMQSNTGMLNVSDAFIAPTAPRLINLAPNDTAQVYQQGGANDPTVLQAESIQIGYSQLTEMQLLRNEVRQLRLEMRNRGPIGSTGVMPAKRFA